MVSAPEALNKLTVTRVAICFFHTDFRGEEKRNTQDRLPLDMVGLPGGLKLIYFHFLDRSLCNGKYCGEAFDSF